jgi:hypothetical protein
MARETGIYGGTITYQTFGDSRQPSTPLYKAVETQPFAGQQSVIVDVALWDGAPRNDLLELLKQFATSTVGALAAPTVETSSARSSSRGITALDAINGIAELFAVSAEDVAAAAGIGRTTPMNWQRTGATPRPSTVRDLWRIYGLAMRLRAVLGWEGTKSWIRAGEPSPLAMLESGDVGTWERAVDGISYDPKYTIASRPAVMPGTELDVDLGGGTPARASGRRVRRGRLG